MKKADVNVGTVYSTKVSGNVVPVRIDRENPRGGWDGTNLVTNKAVRIKSAQRLRGKAATWPGKADEKPTDRVAETIAAVETAEPADAAAPVGKKRRSKAAPAEKKDRKPSGLDAAVAVLAEAGEPLGAKVMVERMLAKGLWQTGGKTPAATIYAAIIREITVKGDASRFRKTDRGRFELTAAGKEAN